MIADVVFDAPVDHPFSYLVPEGWTLAAGQRVLAPLRGASRVGVVVAFRPGSAEGLKPLLECRRRRALARRPRRWTSRNGSPARV